MSSKDDKDRPEKPGEKKHKSFMTNRFFKALRRSDKKNNSAGTHSEHGEEILEAEEYELLSENTESIEGYEVELDIKPRKHKIQADGKSRLVILANVLVDGKELSNQTVDFGLLNPDAGKLHKIASNQVEFISAAFHDDTVAQVEVLYRYGASSIRKQSKIFLKGGKPEVSVILDPPDGIIRGNGREEVMLSSCWAAFDGEYTIPCPSEFEIVLGAEHGELLNAAVEDDSKTPGVDLARKIFKPFISGENRNVIIKTTPIKGIEKEYKDSLCGMFKDPVMKPVETRLSINKADLKGYVESNLTEVDATGTETILLWGYLTDENTPVCTDIDFEFENLLPEDNIQIFDEFPENNIDSEQVTIDQRVFFKQYEDCIRWVLVHLTGSPDSAEKESRAIKVSAKGAGVTSDPLELKQLNPYLELELNKSSIHAGDLAIITPYMIYPGGKKIPITRKLYNPHNDPKYLYFQVGDELSADEKISALINEQFKVIGNTAQFQAPTDIHDYHVHVHSQVPYKNLKLKQSKSIFILSPEYHVRPWKKVFYEDDNEISYEVLIKPVNKKDWMIEIIIEDESRASHCHPFRQLLQISKGQGVTQGKYKFARAGKPSENGGLIKIYLADHPEVFSVVRVLAPFRIKLTTKLARFRIDQLDQIGQKKVNFQQEYKLWVKPAEPGIPEEK